MSKLSSQHGINIKNTNKIFYIFILSLQNLTGILFHTYRSFQPGPGTIQALNCHMWPLATILDISALDTTYKWLWKVTSSCFLNYTFYFLWTNGYLQHFMPTWWWQCTPLEGTRSKGVPSTDEFLDINLF